MCFSESVDEQTAFYMETWLDVSTTISARKAILDMRIWEQLQKAHLTNQKAKKHEDVLIRNPFLNLGRFYIVYCLTIRILSCVMALFDSSRIYFRCLYVD